MHIFQINASYKPAYIYGGPTLSVSKLSETLSGIFQESGDSLEVLTTKANGNKELDTTSETKQLVDGVNVRYFNRITKDHSHFSPDLLSYLGRQLNKKDSKVIVHIHAWWNLVSVFSCLVAKWKNVPVILSPRGMLTQYTFGNRSSIFKKMLHRTIGKNLLRYCHMHATSEQERNDILQFIQPKSLTVIPNLVNFPSVTTVQTNSKTTESDTFKLLFLSRIEEKKGLELLFGGLTGLNTSWKLTIAGSGDSGYLDSLKNLAEKLNIAAHITWAGQISNESKFDLIRSNDLLCLTSYNENFANVVVESLSMGTPVLLSKNVGLADYVTENDLGWITVLNTEDISKTLNLSFEASAQREKIRMEAPAKIEADFSDHVLAQRYIELYKSILDE